MQRLIHSRRHYKFYIEITKNNNEYVRNYISKYPNDINCIFTYENFNNATTPIKRAIYYQATDVVVTLIRAGADLSSPNILSYCFEVFSYRANIIDKLIKTILPCVDIKLFIDAVLNALTSLDPVIIQQFIPKYLTVKQLEEAGYNVTLKALENMKLRFKLKFTADDRATFEFLISQGANVKKVNEKQQTVLHIAASAFGLTAEFVEFFTKLGVDLNAQDYQGNTALHIAAAQRNFIDNVRVILSFGAIVSITNIEGKTADLMTSNEEIKSLICAKSLPSLLGQAILKRDKLVTKYKDERIERCVVANGNATVSSFAFIMEHLHEAPISECQLLEVVNAAEVLVQKLEPIKVQKATSSKIQVDEDYQNSMRYSHA